MVACTRIHHVSDSGEAQAPSFAARGSPKFNATMDTVPGRKVWRHGQAVPYRRSVSESEESDGKDCEEGGFPVTRGMTT